MVEFEYQMHGMHSTMQCVYKPIEYTMCEISGCIFYWIVEVILNIVIKLLLNKFAKGDTFIMLFLNRTET